MHRLLDLDSLHAVAFTLPYMRVQGHEVLCKIGEGGMADVYLAEQIGPGAFRKLCVLKTLKPSLRDTPEMVASFGEEARVSASLNHRNIVSVYQVFEHEGLPFLAMEYLDGLPFSHALRSKCMPLSLQLFVLSEVLLALEYVHTLRDEQGAPLQMVHRDVSPPNIFLTFDGSVKVLDFGIAKSRAAGAGTLTAAGSIKGKLHYMAPEQMLGDAVDGRADLYAVGVMLWEALAGQRMWADHTEVTIMKRVLDGALPELAATEHEALATIARRALAGPTAERYASAQHMRSELLAAAPQQESAETLRAFLAKTFEGERDARRAMVQSARANPDSGNQLPSPLAGDLPAAGGVTFVDSPKRRSAKWRPPRWLLASLAVPVAIGLMLLLLRRLGTAQPTLPRPLSLCPHDTLIADFETGFAELCRTTTRKGGPIILYGDGTGRVEPPLGTFRAATPLQPARGVSRYALRFAARGVTDWGYGIAAMLNGGEPLDVRSFSGIELWIRANNKPVSIKLATKQTLERSYGGSCVTSDRSWCDDHFAYTREFGSNWGHFRIPFSALKQEGWGVRAEWDPTQVMELHIKIAGKKDDPQDAEVWVDDVAFLSADAFDRAPHDNRDADSASR